MYLKHSVLALVLRKANKVRQGYNNCSLVFCSMRDFWSRLWFRVSIRVWIRVSFFFLPSLHRSTLTQLLPCPRGDLMIRFCSRSFWFSVSFLTCEKSFWRMDLRSKWTQVCNFFRFLVFSLSFLSSQKLVLLFLKWKVKYTTITTRACLLQALCIWRRLGVRSLLSVFIRDWFYWLRLWLMLCFTLLGKLPVLWRARGIRRSLIQLQQMALLIFLSSLPAKMFVLWSSSTQVSSPT